jgi:hypothetical protein
MAVIILNANTAAAWVSAIATIGSPTATELNGGIRLEGLLTSDGLSVSPRNNKLSIANLGTKYELERFSTVGYDVKLKFHHDTVTDTGWTTFPFKTLGFLAIRRGIAKATTFATGQGSGGANGTLLVLPLECGMADEIDPPNNWDFELDFALTADPADRAVVA